MPEDSLADDGPHRLVGPGATRTPGPPRMPTLRANVANTPVGDEPRSPGSFVSASLLIDITGPEGRGLDAVGRPMPELCAELLQRHALTGAGVSAWSVPDREARATKSSASSTVRITHVRQSMRRVRSESMPATSRVDPRRS